MSTELLTLPEVAKWLRVRQSTIRSYVLHRRIPFVKAGRILFDKAAVEKWIASRVVPADEETTRG
jgi:excisionase family DNA binding protein